MTESIERTEQDNERDWAEKIGKPAAESIVEMVACLNADRERLEELRDELTDQFDEQAEQNDPNDKDSLLAWIKDAAGSPVHPFQDSAEEYLDLIEAVTLDGEEQTEEEARERIEQDALSVRIFGEKDLQTGEWEADRFEILLTTGGPAVRIMGELGEHNEPSRAWLEVQDWFKPWTQYFEVEQETLLAYCRCFYFGE